MENKDIVEALEKAPELVKAAETFKATSGHIVSSIADAVKQRPQAEIPESELQKISQTPCAPPDVDSFSKALVQKVAGDIGSTIKEKVDEALEGATVKVQHTQAIGENNSTKSILPLISPIKREKRFRGISIPSPFFQTSLTRIPNGLRSK